MTTESFTPPTPPTPPRKPRMWLRYGGVAIVSLLVGVGIGSSSKDDDPKSIAPATETTVTDPPEATDAATTTDAPTTTAKPKPTTTTAARTWTPADFAVTFTVIESECYNSAGGLVTVEATLAVSDTAAWNDDATIVYAIHGGENAETNSIDINPDGTYGVDREVISTATCDAILTAEVTQVIVR